MARHELGPAGAPAATRRCWPRRWTGCAPTCSCGPGARSVVLAHAFVGGGRPSDSERDICVGGVDLVPAAVFDGVDYVALGHLHRPQTAEPAAALQRLAAGLLLRRGRAAEAGLAGRARRRRARPTSRRCRCPCPRPLTRAHRHPRRAARRPGARRGREPLRLRAAHRPGPPGRPDAPAAGPVPALRAPGVGRRRRAGDAPQLPRAAARAAATSRSPAEFVAARPRAARPRRAERDLLAARSPRPRAGRGGRMRLHSLSLTAFGRSPGTVEVDLDEVGRDGLFLLWGPTGAGKTTLLDARRLRVLRHRPRRPRRGEAAPQRPRRRRRRAPRSPAS